MANAARFLGVLLVFTATLALPAPVQAPEFLHHRGVRVLFVGDIMLDRNVARFAQRAGAAALFASTTKLFLDADLRIANLEGTITNNPSLSQTDSHTLRFTFDPAVAKAALEPLRLSAVSLANNHSLDFYQSGYEQTRSYLQAWGIASFGEPYNKKNISTRLVFNGKTICVVGYHALYEPKTATVEAEISSVQPCWRTVVFAHWGEEYRATSTPFQQEAARKFIDAGADLVVGAHPHVVEEVEVYRGRAIFYSLGNFMFDQDFSWETSHGLALRADFYEGETRFILTPVVTFGGRSFLAVGEEKARVLGSAGVEGEFALLRVP